MNKGRHNTFKKLLPDFFSIEAGYFLVVFFRIQCHN